MGSITAGYNHLPFTEAVLNMRQQNSVAAQSAFSDDGRSVNFNGAQLKVYVVLINQHHMRL